MYFKIGLRYVALSSAARVLHAETQDESKPNYPDATFAYCASICYTDSRKPSPLCLCDPLLVR